MEAVGSLYKVNSLSNGASASLGMTQIMIKFEISTPLVEKLAIFEVNRNC